MIVMYRRLMSSVARYPWLDNNVAADLHAHEEAEDIDVSAALALPQTEKFTTSFYPKCATVFVVDCSRSAARSLPEALFQLQKTEFNTVGSNTVAHEEPLQSRGCAFLGRSQQNTSLWRVSLYQGARKKCVCVAELLYYTDP